MQHYQRRHLYHGHLGPEPLRINPPLQTGGVFCIGVNQQHYQTHDFASCLGTLVADNVITPPDILETAIYARKAEA